MSYCTYCNTLPIDHVDRIYHDTVYGRSCTDDRELFGRLILEINQAVFEQPMPIIILKLWLALMKKLLRNY